MWVYSDPRWWIDQIATACAEDSFLIPRTEPPDAYFGHLKDGLAGTLQYLGARPQLEPEQVRRSLFFAKALKKWRLPLGETSDPQLRARRAMAGFVERNLAAADDSYIPAECFCMRRVLESWLPDIRGKRPIYGKFGPGAVAERYKHPKRFCVLTEWLDAGMDPDHPTAYFSHADTCCAGVSRLCAVPKDWDKDRLITVEPCLSSYRQQYVRSLILESIHSGPLRGTAMDLGYVDGQAKQRRLALIASRTGSYATLDLSDASDRISWAAVQAVFPEWVVDELFAARSDYFELPGKARCSEFLNIYAGMGNATTFAVETLFFSAYVVAVCKTRGLRPFVSTFGDDIIVTNEVALRLMEEDDKPFFVINRSKSFHSDSAIRESCGIYAHNGHDVTVPKVDGYLPNWEGRLGVADLHNRLVQSTDAFQHLLAHAIASCGELPNWPYHVEGYPSLCDWSADWSVAPKSRRNKAYQRREVKVQVEKPTQVTYRTEDPFVDESLDPDVLGLSERELYISYIRSLLPEARVWYDCVLSRTRSSGDARVLSPHRSTRSMIAFPTGKSRMVWRWCRCIP